MKTKRVSIIIPAYNEEAYLPLCLDSILNLDFPKADTEIILVDNGSTDRTREIALSYGVRLLCDDTLNVSGLRNLGAKHAEGEILAFVDADCMVSETWLTDALIYADMPDVAAWGAPPAIPENGTWVQKTWSLIFENEQAVQAADWLASMNLFVRKETFLDVNGFNEALVTCEDVDFCYRIQTYGKILSDAKIKMVHLGEARTIREFIRKERWRGSSNLDGIRSHGFSLKELPSLSIPFYFGILIPLLFLCAIFSQNLLWLAGIFLLMLLPTGAVLFKIRRKQIRMSALVKLLLLIQVYFYSRTIAVLK